MYRDRCIANTLGIALIVALAAALGCSDKTENPPPVLPDVPAPAGAYGTITRLCDDCPSVIMLFWTEESEVDGFNVYRSIGGGEVDTLNDSLVTADSNNVIAPDLTGFVFVDDDFDSSSTEEHVYHITSVQNGRESIDSAEVRCVPSEYDDGAMVDDLSPDASLTVAARPEFSWQQESEAGSYVLTLHRVVIDTDSSVIVWMYRYFEAEFDLGDSIGITYLPLSVDTLDHDTRYLWELAAIDDDNFAFKHGYAGFRADNPNSVKRLLDPAHQRGEYRICWDQTDRSGSQVEERMYTIRMTTYDRPALTTEVGIDTAAPPRPDPDCDGRNPGQQLPTQYDMWTAWDWHFPGDIIAVDYDIPMLTEIRIDVVR